MQELIKLLEDFVNNCPENNYINKKIEFLNVNNGNENNKNVNSNNNIFLKFIRLNKKAIIPSKNKGDAGLDIYPFFEEDYKVIKPHETVLIPTGLASIIPEGYYIQIQERGSTGSKGIKYSAGVIDSSYRGEWFLAVTNTNNIPVIISKFNLDNLPALKKMINEACIVYPYDKALFQGVVHKVEDIKVEETDVIELKNCQTNRGDGKLGSSNK